MSIEELREELFKYSDEKFQAFQAKLLPTLEPRTVIGVKTPVLRALASRLYAENDHSELLAALPHEYFEEEQLHAFLISEIKDFELCMEKLNEFLPFVDNWATCDQMSPKCFKKHTAELLAQIRLWLTSERTYTLRFAIAMLMRYFLDDDFDPEYPRLLSALRTDEYYVKMMIAWYFATALAKQYEAVIPVFENNELEPWTHNKALQKAMESYRIPDERKKYLRTLRR